MTKVQLHQFHLTSDSFASIMGNHLMSHILSCLKGLFPHFLICRRKSCLLEKKKYIYCSAFRMTSSHYYLIYNSAILNVDELQCVFIWNTYLRECILEGQKSLDSSRLKSIETIIRVRDFYFSHSQYIWKILQEVIRIDGDQTHVYHFPASQYLDKILEKYSFSNSSLITLN